MCKQISPAPFFRRNYSIFLHSIAATALSLAGVSTVNADHVEEVSIVRDQQFLSHSVDVAASTTASADAAQLLSKAPGGSFNGNGPLTGIPQYRGMYGPRVAATVNGFGIAPAGPNWMDPPLSYTAPAQLESLQVYRGMAPVSAAQEAIGGLVVATTLQHDFASTDQIDFSGLFSAGGESVNESNLFSAVLSAAGRNNRLSVNALTEQADDAEFAEGDILPTEYDRQRYGVNYGARSEHHEIQLAYTRNETGDTGTPALPMDIETIDGDLYSALYQYKANDYKVEVRAFANELDHGMTNFHLRTSPATGLWRRNVASSDNQGASVKATFGAAKNRWVLGVDYFAEEHQSDISNPNMAMFFVQNFNSVEREVAGVFLERMQSLGDKQQLDIGIRVNRVTSDADTVDATPAQMMVPAGLLRDAFNAADRSQSDTNVDLVAKWQFKTESANYYLGLGHKSRAPSYIERYLWLPLQATGGLADGLVYTGNIELDSEVATELELGLELQGERLQFAPRVFYREVNDYIQGTPSSVAAAINFVNMMNMMNGTSTPAPLQFNNVDAVFWGFDANWRFTLSDNWYLSGLLNLVRGERDDIDDDLYRISPDNATVALTYEGKRWSASAEVAAYADQNRVSETNNEAKTDGYELFNLSGLYQLDNGLSFAGGVDNVFDENYEQHTGGYNRAANPDIAIGERLPGLGRNAYLRMTYSF